jgi:hypothetical protein
MNAVSFVIELPRFRKLHYLNITQETIFLTADLSCRSVWGVGHGCLDTGIADSNLAQSMDVCPCLSVLWYPVLAEA